MKLGFTKDLVYFKWAGMDILVHKDHAKEFGKRMTAIGNILKRYNLDEVLTAELQVMDNEEKKS